MKKVLLVLAIIAAMSGCVSRAPTEIHEHADFKVYINGVAYNFSQEKYMSSENRTLSNFIHLHDMSGRVIHKHLSGIDMGYFFKTLGMKFNSTCFVLDTGEEYCNDDTSTLKMYVNSMRNYEYENYEFRDLDRILITYGNESEKEIEEQINSVTNESCIYSEKCPERGAAPEEKSCLTSGECPPERS